MNKQPIRVQQRIEILDIYRGFAVFGIFVVNSVIMNSTFLNQDEFAKQWTSKIDHIFEVLLQLFFYTKFFPIFSLLFGLGIAMQALKLSDSNTSATPFFIRRMLILFSIGLFHIIFLWSGDVLHIYAILGLLTTIIIKKTNRSLLLMASILLVFPFYNPLIEYIFTTIHFQPHSYLNDYTGVIVNDIIRNGSYLDGIKLRSMEYLSNIPMLLGFLAPVALSMFLIGLYIGKNKIYKSIDVYTQRIKKPMLITFVFTNCYRLLFLFVLPNIDIYRSSLRPYFIKLMVLSDIAMGLFYLWLIAWIWYFTRWKKVLSPFRYVGRMALTNYIMQSVIGVFLFTSVGLSMYETLRPSQTFGLAVAVFIFQLIYSKIWLSYFKYGPLEWIWRSLTYKKILPIKLGDT